jgi:hypothetical protein
MAMFLSGQGEGRKQKNRRRYRNTISFRPRAAISTSAGESRACGQFCAQFVRRFLRFHCSDRLQARPASGQGNCAYCKAIKIVKMCVAVHTCNTPQISGGRGQVPRPGAPPAVPTNPVRAEIPVVATIPEFPGGYSGIQHEYCKQVSE